ncbi:MAG: hypothetical protein M3326_15400 [Actinomycetota bacterium]|nr:hypothetical protein [Actinomycetota bacterium]
MNIHSNGRWLTGGVLLLLALGACGGGSDDGGAPADKRGWEAKHGAVVTAVSTDVDTANAALDKGDRPVILSSCNQLQEDLADARKAVPVPDATVDARLRAALDAVGTAVPTCLQGARVASDNRLVEQAQREMKDARAKLDEATKAIDDWS